MTPITEAPVLHTYTNGNCAVTLYGDGTKVREYEGEPDPMHPESMDIKITNRCQHNCAFCHEKSTPEGAHADIAKLLEVLEPLPAGVEVALGGGNVFEHPDLMHLLLKLQTQGLVANMTVNLEDAFIHAQELHHFQGLGQIHGLGVSVPPFSKGTYPKPLFANGNVVFHLIAGVNYVTDVQALQKLCAEWGIPCKVLVLGYKNWGRGKAYHQGHKASVTSCLKEWKTGLGTLFTAKRLTLSFDNLALKQLNVVIYLTPKQWAEFYMGDDGQFTMYVDAVKQEFAMSSISTGRVPFAKSTLLDYFKSLQPLV